MSFRLCALPGFLAAVLTGCSASQSGVQAGGVGPVSLARPSAPSSLLYITDVGTNSVYVYSYPDGTLVDTLTGFNSPVRDCSDRLGNVYITNTESEEVLKFAHGGDEPIATFDDRGYLPWDCSVDPSSGALAVWR